MGQAVGTAAAITYARSGDLWASIRENMSEIQQALLRDGCFLPHVDASDASDLAQQATLRASSTFLVDEITSESASELGGLDHWRDYPIFPEDGKLERRLAQWIAVGEGQPVLRLSVCLSNRGVEPVEVGAHLYAVPDIWTYAAEPSVAVREGTLTVEPGERRWVGWDVEVSPEEIDSSGYVRLDLDAALDVEWHVSTAILPGQVAAYEVAPGRHRRFGGGSTLSYRVEPAQNAYPVEHVVNGVTRPHRTTNMWRSAASSGPEWLQLEWEAPERIGQVQLTFPGHLLREYHACPPGYRDPQCARDYRILGETPDGWRTLTEVSGNYQTRRSHSFDVVEVTRLRIEVEATNGDPSVAISEIRCYAEATCTVSGVRTTEA